MGVKTYMDDDTFGVANTLLVDVLAIAGCIVTFEGLAIDKICICDSLAWFFPINFKVMRWMTWPTKLRIQNLITNL